MPLAILLILVGLILYLVLHGVIATLGLIMVIVGLVLLIYDLAVARRRGPP